MSKAPLVRQLPIFVSSPGDMVAERQVVVRVCEQMNQLESISRHYKLVPLLYENEVAPEVGAAPQMIVDRHSYVLDSYLVVCMMWSRMGTPFHHPETGERFASGTLYEFMTAYRSLRKNGQPRLLLYRKTTPNPQADPQQQQKVNSFFENFEGPKARLKGLYYPFEDARLFEDMLRKHIDKMLNLYPPETPVAPEQPGKPDTFTGTMHVNTVGDGKNFIIGNINNSEIHIDGKTIAPKDVHDKRRKEP